MRVTTTDSRFRRRHALVAALAGATLVVAIGPATAETGGRIRVYMDHARILKLDRPVEKVIIGNSNIADVTVADPKTIVLTGKSFGATNLVLLGKDGKPILDDNVLVSIDEENTVRVYRQADRTVLSCSPYCEENTTGAPPAGK
ncbi:MAG: pilus assembly protein N-terminal domain-containing protein [Pararhizobium sp.]